MAFTPYTGDRYWDYSEIISWCYALAEHLPEWISITEIGQTSYQNPILLITFGKNIETTPMFWVDAGTHASEWTGVMAAIFAMSSWAQELENQEGQDWFSHNSIAILPCVSPDGYQHLRQGGHFVRSSLRPPLPGTQRIGLDPQDMSGDGNIRWMRWKHPAGPYCADSSAPMGLRKRTLQDHPDDAYFLSTEGAFVEWDGASWKQAALKNGIDLNRNFPVHWSPFSMFGMDAGIYPLSEVESQVATKAIADLPNVCLALSNHTYTGALLTQPYHSDPDLGDGDIQMMQELAEQSVTGTDYRVIKVYPDFAYDPKKRIIGVWADFLSNNMGLPAYTLELWNPFAWAGVEMNDPASFFGHPDPKIIHALIKKASTEGFEDWRKHNHPQLGDVEIGGFTYLTTIRNPPEMLLEEECKKGLTIANNMRAALPKIQLSTEVEKLDNGWFSLSIIMENHGFLSTTTTQRAENLSLAAVPSITLETNNGPSPCTQRLETLEGWGTGLYKQNPIYASIGGRSCRGKTTWVVQAAEHTIQWDAGRAGSGTITIDIA